MNKASDCIICETDKYLKWMTISKYWFICCDKCGSTSDAKETKQEAGFDWNNKMFNLNIPQRSEV